MNYKDKLKNLKNQLARLPQFKNRCLICHIKAHKRGMTFHHLNYVDGEKTYKDFDGNTLAYYEYLAPIIRKNPERFLYLCSPHHHFLERSARWSDSKWKRLNRARKYTRQGHK